MQYELRFQDPSSDSTTYLYEQVIRELNAPYTTRFEGVFAFASRQGVADLLEDPDFHRFLSRGGLCTLVVGIDAVTDRRTLELLELLCARHAALEVKVFHNDVADLFHPKLARFTHDDGGATMIVGSGNLTPGGLRRNIEAYSVTVIDPSEIGQVGHLVALDDFLARHAGRIRDIDEEAKARAHENRWRGGRRRRDVEPENDVTEAEVAEEEAIAQEPQAADAVLRDDQRMLVAQVPRAGRTGAARWHQVHFSQEAISEYFRMATRTPHSSDRAFVYEIQDDGTMSPPKARRVIFSTRNVNHKIEFSARGRADYPDDGPPILVVREIGHHMHRYRMVFPGEDGYEQMNGILDTGQQVGRLPTKRVIVSAGDALVAWPACPV